MTNDVHLHIHLPFTSSTVNRRFYYITFSLKTVYYHLILLMGDGVCLVVHTEGSFIFVTNYTYTLITSSSSL